jgi:hypothetical protein
MRKVLLASTALVALTSVSAMAADVTISGSMNFIYSSDAQDENKAGTANGAALGSASDFEAETDMNVMFTATTDSGITTTLNMGVDEADQTDETTATISGDFGEFKIITGNNDDNYVVGMDEAHNKAGEGTAGTSFGLGGVEGESLGYKLPSLVDGLTVAVQHSNEDTTESFGYGVSYNAGIVTATYAYMETDNATSDRTERTSMNLAGSVAGIGFGIEKNEIALGTSIDEATLWGVSYTMDSLTLAYESGASENESGDFDDYTQIAVSYAIAPGITAVLTSSEVNAVAAAATEVEEIEAQLKLSF